MFWFHSDSIVKGNRALAVTGQPAARLACVCVCCCCLEARGSVSNSQTYSFTATLGGFTLDDSMMLFVNNLHNIYIWELGKRSLTGPSLRRSWGMQLSVSAKVFPEMANFFYWLKIWRKFMYMWYVYSLDQCSKACLPGRKAMATPNTWLLYLLFFPWYQGPGHFSNVSVNLKNVPIHYIGLSVWRKFC